MIHIVSGLWRQITNMMFMLWLLVLFACITEPGTVLVVVSLGYDIILHNTPFDQLCLVSIYPTIPQKIIVKSYQQITIT